MTVCRGPEVSRTQGKGKYDFQGCHVVVERVEEAGPGIYGFLPEHEFWGGHNLLHYKSGVFGTERLAR